MSRRLTPISSTDDPEMSSNDGIARSRTSISTVLASSRPARSCSRSRSRVDVACSRVICASVRGLAERRRRRRRQQQIEQPLLGRLPRLLAHLDLALLAHHLHGDLDEIAHHRLDVAADVADLGELRRFDLEERRLREPRQPPRDLGLADAGRTDHQDVLRRDFLGHVGRQPLPAIAVAQRDRHGALRLAPGRRRTCRARRRSRAASATRRASGRALGQRDRRHVTALPATSWLFV